MTIVSVLFAHGNGTASLDVEKADTPSGMPDRIPPRVTTLEDITVTPDDLSSCGESVSLTVIGQDSNHGIVTINGQSTPQVITRSETIDLSSPDGATQTEPGYAGNLQLVAIAHGVHAVQSYGFSVAAIPQNYTETLLNPAAYPLPAGFMGFVVQDGWQSDSGNPEDLSDVDLKEVVQISSANGVWVGISTIPSSYLSATNPNGTPNFTKDRHFSPTSLRVSPGGTQITDQLNVFHDARTGATDIPMTDSGYMYHSGGGLQFHHQTMGIHDHQAGHAHNYRQLLHCGWGGIYDCDSIIKRKPWI